MIALITACANGHPVIAAEGQTVCHCGALLNGARGEFPTIDLREAIPAITGHLDASDVQPLDPGQGGPDA